MEQLLANLCLDCDAMFFHTNPHRKRCEICQVIHKRILTKNLAGRRKIRTIEQVDVTPEAVPYEKLEFIIMQAENEAT